MKKIIIAGAGIGGLAVGGILAKNGYNVSIYSKGEKENHGYDWCDCMSISDLEKLIGKKLTPEEALFSTDSQYINPSKTAHILNKFSDGKCPPKLERAVLSKYLIEFAEESGAKIFWGVSIKSALTENARVKGINTSIGNIYGDLVIDACGIFSPVRESLPDECLVEQKCAYGEVFYAYRGLYKRNKKSEIPEYPYEIYLLHQFEPGISWYITEDDFIDILIGRLKPFEKEKVDAVINDLKINHPELTTELIRGGNHTFIPVRRPLVKPVCDGYAAIGDSAYMTYPMIGSGIDLSIIAAKLLSETVIADKSGAYTTESLWNYQYKYITQHGKDLAAIDRLKNTLLNLNPKAVDYFIDKKIITEKEFNTSSSVELTKSEMIKKALIGLPKLLSLIKIANASKLGEADKKVYAAIPKQYEKSAFIKWKADVEKTIVRITR